MRLKTKFVWRKKTPYEKRIARKRIVRVLCVVGFVLLMMKGLSPFISIGFNTTDSVKGYVFLIVKDVIPPKNGLVAFNPPENEFYQHRYFVKYLKGVPGDRITRQGQSFYLNNEYIGDAKTHSKSGIPLVASKPGLIPSTSYFVWTPHKDSFDSRYAQIGWIPQQNIIGRAYRMF